MSQLLNITLTVSDFQARGEDDTSMVSKLLAAMARSESSDEEQRTVIPVAAVAAEGQSDLIFVMHQCDKLPNSADCADAWLHSWRRYGER